MYVMSRNIFDNTIEKLYVINGAHINMTILSRLYINLKRSQGSFKCHQLALPVWKLPKRSKQNFYVQRVNHIS